MPLARIGFLKSNLSGKYNPQNKGRDSLILTLKIHCFEKPMKTTRNLLCESTLPFQHLTLRVFHTPETVVSYA